MTDKLSGYSTTPASNNSPSPDGWPEGMTAGSLNNSDREFAARVREFYEDSQWIDFGHTIVSSTGSSIKLSGDVTSIYTAGRAIRVNQDSSMDGWVSASAYSAPDTSITVTGFTVAAPTQVEVGAVKDHTVLPNNLSITVASLAVSGNVTVGGSVSITGALNVAGTFTATEFYNSNGDPFTRALNIDVKTTGTGATWTWPGGITAVKITAVGGGGNGGNGAADTSLGGGGGGGGCVIKRLSKVTGQNTITYTVGGAAANSTFIYNSTTYTAGAGSNGSSVTPGAGGTATAGDLNIGGCGGVPGRGYAATYATIGSTGGSSHLGGGGVGTTGNGNPGKSYGGGGAGGGHVSGQVTGGAGAAGVVIFEY